MASRISKKTAKNNGHVEEVIRPVREMPSATSREYAIEMEMLSIAASKAARGIFEELGSSCPGTQDNDDSEVFGGADPHETIDDVNAAIEIGDSLSRISWGSNAMNNRSYYIVDNGHGPITAKPKQDSDTHKASAGRIQKFLDDWVKEVGWYTRQSEVSNRLDRHGEVLDILYYEEGGLLRLQFAEPTDMEEDADSKYRDTEDSDLEYIDRLGVRRTNNLMFQPVAYFIDGDWYNDLQYMTPMNKIAEFPEEQRMLIQHRKRNVLSRDDRGLNLYWPVREELTWAKRLMANLMRMSSFQAAFGAIRTISEMHSADQVKSYLASQQTGTANANAAEKFDFPATSVVTVPASVKWEFPETGAGNANQIEVLLGLLRACAAGLRLPEFMLTANVSEGNFASTLVSEGPFHKGMRFEQNLMNQEDMRILMQALRWAAQNGVDGITETDVDNVMIECKMPRVQTRNRKEDFEVNESMWKDSVISAKTFAASEDRDYEAEQNQIAVERSVEHPAPLAIQKVPTQPGPEAGLQSDPLKEKGVMAGEPVEDPLKQ